PIAGSGQRNRVLTLFCAVIFVQQKLTQQEVIILQRVLHAAGQSLTRQALHNGLGCEIPSQSFGVYDLQIQQGGGCCLFLIKSNLLYPVIEILEKQEENLRHILRQFSFRQSGSQTGLLKIGDDFICVTGFQRFQLLGDAFTNSFLFLVLTACETDKQKQEKKGGQAGGCKPLYSCHKVSPLSDNSEESDSVSLRKQ